MQNRSPHGEHTRGCCSDQLRRLAMVEAQQPAESFTPRHRRVVVGGCGEWRDQPVVEPLVVALHVIMLDELADSEAEVPLTERDQPVQALALDGQHEALGEGVEIWAMCRQLHASDACRTQDVPELLREERVSVVDEEPLAGQEAVDAIGEVARDLLHLRAAGVPRHAADLRSARLEVDGEEHERAHEPGERQHLHGKEVDCADGSGVALRKVFHGIRLRRAGAGSRPWSSRMRLMVLRPSSWPRLRSAPRILVYPQLGFSEANLTTSCCTLAALAGLPALWRAEPSYFLAMSSRYQRKSVSGVTMPASSSRRRRPSGLPLAASRRRWSLLNRNRRLLSQHPVLLLEVVDHLKWTHPAKNISKKRNASVPIGCRCSHVHARALSAPR